MNPLRAARRSPGESSRQPVRKSAMQEQLFSSRQVAALILALLIGLGGGTLSGFFGGRDDSRIAELQRQVQDLRARHDQTYERLVRVEAKLDSLIESDHNRKENRR